MISKRIRQKVMLSGLVLVLAACQSTSMTTAPERMGCKPLPPQLEWYEANGDGVYYPKRSVINLQLYIDALNNCIDYHQTNPG
ncbi:hypothetical protein [Vibrio vulnificus]|uniref:hypothetical protein n=1 Tax=Vibrio vulnificus TaxID=672 RepID=UPI001A197C4B|nr:hypothetical protein [Vibrio vulnificus]MCJ0806662.1 hypothetical protein [Vibrio vulnificus]HAS6087745.1 hypothetical protein [Vibrio vulnificus]